jgi:tetratricopeptide (TPR) repeat protein
MIITDRFVFIHMHKTGGQTLNDAITDCIRDHQVVGYHFPRRMIPAQYTHLPVVGLVRNPWSWYVSWYSFNRQPNIRNSLYYVVSEDGRLDFASTVSNLVRLGSDDESARRQREQLIDILPETLDGNRGVGLTRQDIGDLGDSGQGYYSWMFARMLGAEDDANTHIGRFEHLRDDFLGIMQTLDVPERDALAWAMDYGKRKNTSRHSHYSHYYNDQVRQLVADHDAPLIERFDYAFDVVGPVATDAGQDSEVSADDQNGFRKLLGRADNYLQLHSDYDIEPLRAKVQQLTAETWGESDRDEHFHVHRDTQSVTLVEFVAHRYEEPLELPIYEEFRELLRPIVEHIADFYQDNGFVVRILLAKLRAGCRIEEHVDSGYSLLAVHRVHVPIITNDATVFSVGGEKKQMRCGEFWEIDNSKTHAVENNSTEDRVHMIVDWMPNQAGGSVKAAIEKVRPAAAARPGEARPALDQMIAQAFEFQREGKPHKAEARYRHVLDIDPDNAVCNNLMGMLCRQMRRYDEAVEYIRAAIKSEPNDAKAHANLGQALLMKGDFAESVQSFQQALALSPNLESARVGLQRAQLELQQRTGGTPGQ